jgi:hypothetical protein
MTEELDRDPTVTLTGRERDFRPSLCHNDIDEEGTDGHTMDSR